MGGVWKLERKGMAREEQGKEREKGTGKKRGKERGKEREWEERRLVENRFRMETTVDLPHGLTLEITIDREKIYITQRVKRNSLDLFTIVAKTA